MPPTTLAPTGLPPDPPGPAPRGRLAAGGVPGGERLEDNLGPIGAVLFSLSVSYCMTTSLAMKGQGLGTCGLPEDKIRQMAERASGSLSRVVDQLHWWAKATRDARERRPYSEVA